MVRSGAVQDKARFGIVKTEDHRLLALGAVVVDGIQILAGGGADTEVLHGPPEGALGHGTGRKILLPDLRTSAVVTQESEALRVEPDRLVIAAFTDKTGNNTVH